VFYLKELVTEWTQENLFYRVGLNRLFSLSIPVQISTWLQDMIDISVQYLIHYCLNDEQLHLLESQDGFREAVYTLQDKKQFGIKSIYTEI
jgi:hypothetical protein